MGPIILPRFALWSALLCLLWSVMAQESSTQASGVDNSTELSHNASNTTDVECEANWHQLKRRCFIFHRGDTNVYNFGEARYKCDDLYSGDLATIEDQETQDFLIKVLSDLNITSPTWIGAQSEEYHHHDKDGEEHKDHHHHDKEEEESEKLIRLRWVVSENEVTFTNWQNSSSMASTAGQCVSMAPNGKWTIQPCTEKTLLFCEKDLEKPKDRSKKVIWAIAYALTAVIFLALLISCCIYCLVRRKAETRRSAGGKFSGIYYKKSSSNKSGN